MKDSERESEIEIMHEAEKASIQLIRLYCQGTVSNVNFVLHQKIQSQEYIKLLNVHLWILKPRELYLREPK